MFNLRFCRFMIRKAINHIKERVLFAASALYRLLTGFAIHL